MTSEPMPIDANVMTIMLQARDLLQRARELDDRINDEFVVAKHCASIICEFIDFKRSTDRPQDKSRILNMSSSLDVLSDTLPKVIPQ